MIFMEKTGVLANRLVMHASKTLFLDLDEGYGCEDYVDEIALCYDVQFLYCRRSGREVGTRHHFTNEARPDRYLLVRPCFTTEQTDVI